MHLNRDRNGRRKSGWRWRHLFRHVGTGTGSSGRLESRIGRGYLRRSVTLPDPTVEGPTGAETLAAFRKDHAASPVVWG